MGAAALLGVGIYYAINIAFGGPATYDGPIHIVEFEKLRSTIVERGELESADNGDIYCRVKSSQRGNNVATSIKWIIEDGTQVQVGDKIVEFDDSGLQEQLRTQNNEVATKKAAWIQAEQNYHIVKSQNESDIASAKVVVKLAEIDLEKYKKGDYVQTLKDIQGRIEISRSELEMNLDRAAWSERMVRKGYLSRSQSEADRARLESSQINLKKVQQELSLLEEYTKERTVIDLESKVAEAKRALDRVQTQAKATLAQAEIDRESKSVVYHQERDKRDELEGEIAKCVIYAPQSGLVVYYVPSQSRSRSGSQQSIVAQGEPVREGQKLMQIPNLAHMIVKVKVHEAMVRKVKGEKLTRTGFLDALSAGLTTMRDPLKVLPAQVMLNTYGSGHRNKEYIVTFPGQLAKIKVDALPNKVFSGHVKTVANVASQASWMSSDVKVYETSVSIDEEVEGLKPGMSAEVTILSQERQKAALTIPIQSVVGNLVMGENRKCFVLNQINVPEERDIVVGYSNAKMVEVFKGLEAGERVVLNPRPLIAGRSDLSVAEPPTPRGAGGFKGKGKGKAPGGQQGGDSAAKNYKKK